MTLATHMCYTGEGFTGFSDKISIVGEASKSSQNIPQNFLQPRLQYDIKVYNKQNNGFIE